MTVRKNPISPTARKRFRHHILWAFLLSTGLIVAMLCLGIAGYHFIAGFSWIDSLLDASMILGGMGPVGALTSDGAKVFASFYALLSGLAFISASGIILSPMIHWVLHRFHIEEKDLK
jgi:putative effector of murein hydrolase